MNFLRYCAVGTALALLGACASPRFSQEKTNASRDAESRQDYTRFGASPTVHSALETVNLIELLDPRGKAELQYENDSKQTDPRAKSDQAWDKLSFSVRYDLIFASFATMEREGSALLHRNVAQNRIVAAADRRCGRYLQYIKEDSSNANMGFGIATSLLTTLGAIAPIAQDARRLSGFGAMTSGVQATFNNEYYSNLSLSVVVRGIESKRTELREKLSGLQQKSYAQYDIAAAVGDAVRYDAACSLINGLEQANEALQRLADPSRDAINKALYKDKLARALSSDSPDAVKNFVQMSSDLNVDPSPLLAGLASTALDRNISGDPSVTGEYGGSNVAAAAANAYARMVRRSTDMQNELVLSFKDASPTLTFTITVALSSTNSNSTTLQMATVSYVIAKLESLIAAQNTALREGAATGSFALCPVEATLVATQIATADANWKSRTLFPAKLTEFENANYAANNRRKTLLEKLDRYVKQQAQFVENTSATWKKALAGNPDNFGKAWLAIAKDLVGFKIQDAVGSNRQCTGKGV